MSNSDSLPDTVSVYYNTAMFNFVVLIGLASLILAAAFITVFGKNKWEYLCLTLPISILVIAYSGYKKLFQFTQGAKGNTPYLKFDRRAVSLIGVSIPWSSVESIETLAIPVRSGSLNFLVVRIKEGVNSLQMRPEQFKWLTQNNKMLSKRFGFDKGSYLSLGAMSYLTLAADKIDSLATAYRDAAIQLRE